MTIDNEGQYQAALREVDTVFLAERGTWQGDRCDELCRAIEAYEAVHHPFPPRQKPAARPARTRRYKARYTVTMPAVAALLGSGGKLGTVYIRAESLAAAEREADERILVRGFAKMVRVTVRPAYFWEWF